jgi:hypothetical protein
MELPQVVAGWGSAARYQRFGEILDRWWRVQGP